MLLSSSILVLILVVGFYMAWNIGANDVANAMGTSVGSGALTLKRAVIVAAILEFSGALLVGSHVSKTIMSGIFDPTIFTEIPLQYIRAMVAALLAAGVWLQCASWFGWPVSTTHSIVGAMVGVGMAVGGTEAIYWDTVGRIGLSWVISPLLGGALSFVCFNVLRRQIFYQRYPFEAAKRVTPWLVMLVVSILTLMMAFKGLKNLGLDLTLWNALGFSVSAGSVAALIAYLFLRRIHVDSDVVREQHFQHPFVLQSLDKVVKHLSRVKAVATGTVRNQASALLHNSKQMQKAVKIGTELPMSSPENQAVERIFGRLQILSACFMAFAHGANDVANAIGPLAGILAVNKAGAMALPNAVQPWVLAFGGMGIVIGLATWGWRVMDTIGKKITELTPSRGFAAEFGAATTIVLASRLGIPVSTTHILVGAVLGVGFARGIGALNLNVVRDIVMSWVITVPAGAILAVFIYSVLDLFA